MMWSVDGRRFASIEVRTTSDARGRRGPPKRAGSANERKVRQAERAAALFHRNSKVLACPR
ncbi:hypothetical protein C7S16_4890 [Burkholderia thailandensis]|uniref:Uncharacterized protein n=1 Tax=Burkholderia thailandensis TaxID=57975 RepID=A0AAW9CUC0_BURTH|nr:hypothetical protein [Burkholderia thailandensis]MDW9251321.1 hypothetical protein [Burkholderia thailandensis]